MNLELFFENIKESLFAGKFKSTSQVAGINAILNESEKVSANELAYILATVYHETAKTMQPIEEYGKGRNRTYGHNVKQNGTRYTNTKNIFYGRGFVQLTWYENYEKMGKIIGVDLINQPELMLQLDVSTKVLYEGMTRGLFTGKKLKDYFGAVPDFVMARSIINGRRRVKNIAGEWVYETYPDCAELIAGYALKFLNALNLSK
jgi:putative chitinase